MQVGQRKVDPKWLTLAVVGSGTFMSALDTSIVNIALPTIGRSTGAGLSTIEWVVLIYLITVSSSLLVFGRLADIYGRRSIYILGQCVFALGSLLCAISGGIGLLIASRAVQGMGAAMVFALSPAVLISAFPAKERGRALGMQATMTYLGMSLGPSLGGILTEHFGWPAIFFVNVPLGVIAIAISCRVLPSSEKGAPQPFDRLGAFLMAVALSCLLLALSKGHDLGWSNPLIVGLLIASLVAWPLFFWVESRTKFPALDLSLFRNRVFTGSTLAALLCYLSTAAINFLMPFFLIQACGFVESRAGFVMSATPILMMCVTGLSGYLSDRIGVRIPSTLGMTLMGCGVMYLRAMTPGASPATIAIGSACVGLGVGLFTAPNNSAIMGSAPEDRRGVAGAILAAARTIGFASGVALSGLVYMIHLHAAVHLPNSVAVSDSVHAGLTLVATVCLCAAVLSALRPTQAKA